MFWGVRDCEGIDFEDARVDLEVRVRQQPVQQLKPPPQSWPFRGKRWKALGGLHRLRRHACEGAEPLLAALAPRFLVRFWCFKGLLGASDLEARHHIVLVLKRSGQASYYIDGVKMNSFTYTPGSENIGMDGSITIGGGHLGRNFQNEVSRFAIWSRAWSDADVAAAATCSVNTQGLEVLYTLDGGYEDLNRLNPGVSGCSGQWKAPRNGCRPGFRRQDLKGNQNDLQRALSKGVFAACSNCQFCPSYPLGSVSVR